MANLIKKEKSAIINRPFRIKKLEVDKSISDFVDLFYVEIDFDESIVSKHSKFLIFPTNTMEINFFLNTQVEECTDKGTLKLPSSFITGNKTKTKIYYTQKREKEIVIRFKNNCPYLFVKEPIYELTDQNISLTDIFSTSEVNDIYEKINLAKSPSQISKYINRFLISKLKLDKVDYMILDAIKKMENSGGNLLINDLAIIYSKSIKQFQRRFKNFVGLTPKQFANNLRLQNLITNYTSGNSVMESIYSSGFYDKSHASKQFSSLTGLSFTNLTQINKQEWLNAVNNDSHLPKNCSSMIFMT